VMVGVGLVGVMSPAIVLHRRLMQATDDAESE